MDAIVNNPFRILGLKPTASDREITKRVSDLLIYAEMGKKVSYETDLEFLGEVDRSINAIKKAAKRIENLDNKLYYSLLWFNNYDKTSEAALNILRNIDNVEQNDMFFDGLRKHNENKPDDLLTIEQAKNRIIKKNETKAEEILLSKLSLSNSSQYEHIEIPIINDVIPLIPLSSESKVIDKQLVLDSKSENGFWLLKEFKFDKTVRFSIKFECEWIKGEENKLYSIVFGKGLINSYYRFGLSANGYIYFDLIENGKAKKIFGWKKDTNIKKQKNKLELHYLPNSGRTFQMYINDCQFPHEYIVQKEQKNVFWGDYLGVSVYGKQMVSFSNSKISYSTGHLTFAEKLNPTAINIYNLINVITYQLSSYRLNSWKIAFDPEKAIILMGKIINSNAIEIYSKTVCGENYLVDETSLSKIYIDDMSSFITDFHG